MTISECLENMPKLVLKRAINKYGFFLFSPNSSIFHFIKNRQFVHLAITLNLLPDSSSECLGKFLLCYLQAVGRVAFPLFVARAFIQ